MPLISARRLEGHKGAPDRIMIMHLKRSHVFEWVRAALASAFGLQGSHLPPVIFQEEVDSVWDQIGGLLFKSRSLVSLFSVCDDKSFPDGDAAIIQVHDLKASQRPDGSVSRK